MFTHHKESYRGYCKFGVVERVLKTYFWNNMKINRNFQRGGGGLNQTKPFIAVTNLQFSIILHTNKAIGLFCIVLADMLTPLCFVQHTEIIQTAVNELLIYFLISLFCVPKGSQTKPNK